MLDPAGSIAGGMPGPIRGDFFSTYASRPKAKAPVRGVDALIPWAFEARASRHLGFKAIVGGATVIYWRHTPVARMAANTSTPHIYISGFHLGGAVASGRAGGSELRAYQGLAPFMDYLMTGLSFEPDGVHQWRAGGDIVTPWPGTARKPALYIPVYGRGHSVPFWTPRRVEFASNRPVCQIGGETWEEPTPFGGMTIASSQSESSELEGLT